MDPSTGIQRSCRNGKSIVPGQKHHIGNYATCRGLKGRTCQGARVGRCPRQDTASNGQETESLNLPAALCCGMKMQTTPTPQLKTVGLREGNRAEPVEIWKARNFIHAHSDEELSLTRVAKAANISPNYLSEKFRQVTGVNFVKYVARTRYENARVLLHDVDLRTRRRRRSANGSYVASITT